LFFGLWPGAAERERLAEAAATSLWSTAAHEGRPVPPADWHMTLCFLGAVEEPTIAGLMQRAAGVRTEPFTVRFDRLRYWKEAGVLAAVADCPPQAARLAAMLRGLSVGLGLAVDEKPLRPHITLVRGLREAHWQGPSEAALELALPAREFHLAQSREGAAAPAARYDSLGHWPLGG
jgi:2'-5' RNA ligase